MYTNIYIHNMRSTTFWRFCCNVQLEKLPPQIISGLFPHRYYLSKLWAGNLRRYVEAQARCRRSPSFSSNVNGTAGVGGSAGKEKRSRGRERAESNLMPPWLDVNFDIVCHHGGLAHSPQGTRRKVQTYWYIRVSRIGWNTVSLGTLG